LRNNKSYEAPVPNTSPTNSHFPRKKGITVNLDEEGEQSLTPEEIARCTPPVPYPQALIEPKKKKGPPADDVLEILRNVKVNIPLIDAINQIPSYAKYLKDIVTRKRRSKKIPLEVNLCIDQPTSSILL